MTVVFRASGRSRCSGPGEHGGQRDERLTLEKKNTSGLNSAQEPGKSSLRHTVNGTINLLFFLYPSISFDTVDTNVAFVKLYGTISYIF